MRAMTRCAPCSQRPCSGAPGRTRLPRSTSSSNGSRSARERGYAIVDEEAEPGLCSVSAPGPRFPWRGRGGGAGRRAAREHRPAYRRAGRLCVGAAGGAVARARRPRLSVRRPETRAESRQRAAHELRSGASAASAIASATSVVRPARRADPLALMAAMIAPSAPAHAGAPPRGCPRRTPRRPRTRRARGRVASARRHVGRPSAPRRGRRPRRTARRRAVPRVLAIVVPEQGAPGAGRPGRRHHAGAHGCLGRADSRLMAKQHGSRPRRAR